MDSTGFTAKRILNSVSAVPHRRELVTGFNVLSATQTHLRTSCQPHTETYLRTSCKPHTLISGRPVSHTDSSQDVLSATQTHLRTSCQPHRLISGRPVSHTHRRISGRPVSHTLISGRPVSHTHRLISGRPVSHTHRLISGRPVSQTDLSQDVLSAKQAYPRTNKHCHKSMHIKLYPTTGKT